MQWWENLQQSNDTVSTMFHNRAIYDISTLTVLNNKWILPFLDHFHNILKLFLERLKVGKLGVHSDWKFLENGKFVSWKGFNFYSTPFRFIEDFGEVFGTSLKSNHLNDDFKEHFESSILRICWGLTIISNLIFSNVLFSMLIKFEHNGEDWAKRSLFNR